jgi:hypothetical protein
VRGGHLRHYSTYSVEKTTFINDDAFSIQDYSLNSFTSTERQKDDINKWIRFNTSRYIIITIFPHHKTTLYSARIYSVLNPLHIRFFHTTTFTHFFPSRFNSVCRTVYTIFGWIDSTFSTLFFALFFLSFIVTQISKCDA